MHSIVKITYLCPARNQKLGYENLHNYERFYSHSSSGCVKYLPSASISTMRVRDDHFDPIHMYAREIIDLAALLLPYKYFIACKSFVISVQYLSVQIVIPRGTQAKERNDDGENDFSCLCHS